MKTIKTIALVIVALFTITSFSNYSFALSPEMEKAIETSRKIEAKRVSINASLQKFSLNVSKMTTSAISKNKEESLKIKYEDILKTVDRLQVEHSTSKSIYKVVIIDLLDDLEIFFDDEIEKLETSLEQKTKTYSGVEVGKTEAEKQEIIEKVIENSSSSSSASEEHENKKILEANWVSPKEASALAIKTDVWDWFEFCANFPSEVYTNNALRQYTWAQSSVAKDYYNFKVKYYKNAFTDRTAHANAWRIQQCVRLMYLFNKNNGLTKSDIETIYEKHYGNYVQFTTPFYLEGVQPEDIETYISNHHNG